MTLDARAQGEEDAPKPQAHTFFLPRASFNEFCGPEDRFNAKSPAERLRMRQEYHEYLDAREDAHDD